MNYEVARNNTNKISYLIYLMRITTVDVAQSRALATSEFLRIIALIEISIDSGSDQQNFGVLNL